MVGGSDLGIFCEFYHNSFGILWEFLGNSLRILSEFFGDVWLGGFKCLGVFLGNLTNQRT